MSLARAATSIRSLVIGGAVFGLLVPVLTVRAFVPEPERVGIAIARANIKAHRNQPLQLQLAIRVGGGPVVAQGELETQPSGLARLELRGAGGLRERHLLHSRGHAAARNGQPLDEPRAMLPPFFLLQTGSLRGLQSSLQGFGIDPLLVGLAPCGPENCYVLGDPNRVPPMLEEAVVSEAAPPAARSKRGLGSFGSLWVEKENFQVRRMRSPGGTKVEFGAEADFGKIAVPAWFEVREPGRDPVRFEIQAVSKSRRSPAEFTVEWVNDSRLP